MMYIDLLFLFFYTGIFIYFVVLKRDLLFELFGIYEMYDQYFYIYTGIFILVF